MRLAILDKMQPEAVQRLFEAKRPEVTVAGTFSDIHALEQAAQRLKDAHLAEYEAFGPVPLVEIESGMRRQGSFVRAVATMGGVAGVVGGFALALWSSTLYDLVVGGKPPTALVPYVVVGYELTILVACISTFIATGHGAKFLPVPPAPEFMARYSSDTFGLHVYCTKTQVDEARRLLEESEAEEIHEF